MANMDVADFGNGQRCKPRKQPNPRRKNVELEDAIPEDADLIVTHESLSKDFMDIAPNNKELKTTVGGEKTNKDMVASPAQREDNCPQSESCANESSHVEQSAKSLCNTSPRNGLTKTVSDKLSRDNTNSNTDNDNNNCIDAKQTMNGHGDDETDTEEETQDKEQMTSSTDDNAVTIDSKASDNHIEEQNEDDKIKEYLQRRDTAVIFPESVDSNSLAKRKVFKNGRDSKNGKSSTGNNNQDDSKTDKTKTDKNRMHEKGSSNNNGISTIIGDLFARCSHCGKLFRGSRSTLSLQEHITNIHAPSSVSPAQSNVSITSIPIKSNDTDKPYICVKCKATFMNKDHLEKHEQLHSTQGQSCQLCNKSFANVYRLQRHMLSHDESQVLRKFKCPECFKAFKFKHHLKEHIRIHSGEKPFACSNCGKRFSHSGSYSSHMTSKKCLTLNLKIRKTDQIRSQRNRNSQSNLNNSPIIRTSQSSLANVDSLVNNISSNHSNNSLRSSMSHHHKEDGYNISNNNMTVLKSESDNISPLYSLPIEFQHCTSDHQTLSNFLPPNFTANLSNMSPSLLSAAAASFGLPTQYLPSALANYPELANVILRSQMDKSAKDIEFPKDKFFNGSIKLDSFKQCDSKTIIDGYDLYSMRKILQIVDATVSAKAQHEPPLSVVPNGSVNDAQSLSISPLTLSASALHLPQIAPIDSPDDNKKFSERCRFCSEYFENKEDLHHHESYLCKTYYNKQRASLSETKDVCSLELFAKSHLPSNIPESDDESQRDMSSLDGEVLTTDEKKARVRSVLSEDTLKILRAQYEVNPRPKKHDILRLSDEVNYSARVVQVWFQNMRARDRRLGRPIPHGQTLSEMNFGDVHLQRSRNILSPSHHPSSQHSISPLLPINVPHFKPAPQFSHSFSPSFSPHYNGVAIFGHRNAVQQSYPMPSEYSPSSLSLKNDSLKRSVHITESSSFQNGISDEPLDLSLKNKYSLPDFNHNININRSCDAEALNLSQKSSRSLNDTPNDTNILLENTSLTIIQQQQRQELEQTSIVRSMLMNKYSPELDIPINRFNSFSIVNGSMQSPDHTARCSPNPNEERNEVKKEICSKRSHSVCEDIGHNSDNTNPSDEFSSADSPSRPRQTIVSPSKVWKGNVDNVISRDEHTPPDPSLQGDGTGLFTCDQCDKTFSKQSSLARHKYEHSGQRPHKCDVCNKAFKHKHHLTEHKRLHSGEKPFQCKKCLKRFSHSGSYSQHMNHRYSYCKPYRD